MEPHLDGVETNVAGDVSSELSDGLIQNLPVLMGALKENEDLAFK